MSKLAITNLAEVTANEMHDINNSQGVNNLKTDVIKSGKVAGEARERIEKEIGKRIATKENYKELTTVERKHTQIRHYVEKILIVIWICDIIFLVSN